MWCQLAPQTTWQSRARGCTKETNLFWVVVVVVGLSLLLLVYICQNQAIMGLLPFGRHSFPIFDRCGGSSRLGVGNPHGHYQHSANETKCQVDPRLIGTERLVVVVCRSEMATSQSTRTSRFRPYFHTVLGESAVSEPRRFVTIRTHFEGGFWEDRQGHVVSKFELLYAAKALRRFSNNKSRTCHNHENTQQSFSETLALSRGVWTMPNCCSVRNPQTSLFYSSLCNKSVCPSKKDVWWFHQRRQVCQGTYHTIMDRNHSFAYNAY